MNIPEDLRYSKEHEWARQEGEFVWVGISDYAQSELGDVVYIDLPAVGDHFKQNDIFGSIEAVKAASDLYCPVAGEIVEVNNDITDSPETINKDPYNDGWMIKLKIDDLEEFNNLMDASEYLAHISD